MSKVVPWTTTSSVDTSETTGSVDDEWMSALTKERAKKTMYFNGFKMAIEQRDQALDWVQILDDQNKELKKQPKSTQSRPPPVTVSHDEYTDKDLRNLLGSFKYFQEQYAHLSKHK